MSTCWSTSRRGPSARHSLSRLMSGPSRLLTGPPAKYIDGTTFFAHADWLGNERVHSKMDASIQDSCANLPFGDALTCPIYGVNALQFTGKLRDAESGNDYFGARYYVSTMARFQSPDWSAGEDPVPYAKLDNPQSLNLYSYVFNNPASGVDMDGHQNQVPDADGPWSLAGSFCATEIGSNNLANCENTAYYGSGGWTGWGAWAQQQNAQGQTPISVDYTLHVRGWGTPLDCASDPICQIQYKQFFGKIPAPNNGLPKPTLIKATIPGTNYCGPGGSGTPTNRTDAACAAHDLCYQNAGVSFVNNLGWPKTAAQTAAIQACDANLCSTLNSNSWPTSAEAGQATIVETFFGCSGGYSLR
jgi:RHS repeat-associated protein